AWILQDVQKCVDAAIAKPVGYRQRSPVEYLDESWRIALRRYIHVPGGVDAGDDDEGASFNPGSTMAINVIDYLGNLAWKRGRENGLDIGCRRNWDLGLIHRNRSRIVRSVRWAMLPGNPTPQKLDPILLLAHFVR